MDASIAEVFREALPDQDDYSLEALFCRFERRQLLQLQRQILSVRRRLPSCSHRTSILRRRYARLSFLLSAIQRKVLHLHHEFEKAVHFIGVTRSELGFSDEVWSLIGKGTSFIPSRCPLSFRELVFAFRNFENRLYWKAFWARRPDSGILSGPVGTMLRDYTLHSHSSRTITVAPDNIRRRFPNIGTLLSSLQTQLFHSFYQLRRRSFERFQNVSLGNLSALQALRDHPRIIFRKADKNLGTVIIRRDLYVDLCQSELQHMHLQQLSWSQLVDSILEAQDIIRRDFASLPCQRFRARFWDQCLCPPGDFVQHIPTFYCLIKIHKPTLRGRPIVAASDLPFRALSGYLGYRLNQILRDHLWLHVHLVRDSRQVVRTSEFRQFSPPRHCWYGIQFDVVELYPSLPTGPEVLQMIADFLRPMGLPDYDLLMQILSFVLRFGWFRYREDYFIQKSGVAMGHPHSPPVANLLVYLLIERHVHLGRYGIYLYRRFLDDGLAIADTCSAVIEAFFERLNSLAPGIRFTWEAVKLEADPRPFVTFLDLKVSFSTARQLVFRTHEKALNQYLYIYSDSLHSPSVKAGLVKTELIRYMRSCTFEEDFLTLRDQFWHRLRNRGYSRLWLAKQFTSVTYSDRHRYLSSTPTSRTDHDLVVFKLRYTYESAALHITRKINASMTYRTYRELGVTSSADLRILTCYLRSKNLGDFLMRNKDHRGLNLC